MLDDALLIGLEVRVGALNGRGTWWARIILVSEDKRFVKVKGITECFGADRWVDVVMCGANAKRVTKRLDAWCMELEKEWEAREEERVKKGFRDGERVRGRKIRAGEL